MNKAYRLLLGLCAAAATLSSCSRSNYAFNPATPAYLGSQPTHVAAARPTPAVVAATPQVQEPIAVEVAPAAAPAAQAEAPAVARVEKKHAVAVQAAAESTAPALAAQTTAPAKPTLVQRMVMNKIAKKLAKAESRQNAAGVSHTAAAGPGVTVSIIGLIALLVGIIAGSGLVITLGAIVLVVGLVILLLGAL